MDAAPVTCKKPGFTGNKRVSREKGCSLRQGNPGTGPSNADLPALKRLGCIAEIVSWKTPVFVPDAKGLERLIERYPAAPPVSAA